jgi:tetratricopeptide (TPR) repeat protein
MNRIILFHHTANTAIAESIVHRLGRIGIPFETITEKTGETPGDIAATLQAHQEPVLLIITDNFLKDTHCMADMLSAFQAVRRERRVVTVVADGRQSDDGGASWHPVPTHYDRMVHALQYMNYWQNAWLELSDRHGASTDASEKEHLLGLLNITRNIANEMGDFIGTLREAEVFSLEQLEENHFALFFQRFGLNDWYDQYRDKEIAIQTAAMRMQEVDTPEPLPAPPEETPVIPERVAETYFSPASSEPVETHEQPTAPSAENISAAQPLIAPHFEQEEHLLKELLPDPEKTHTEIEQHIHDAWFWLNNGRIEQGLAILQTALEAFPDNERLRTEYEKASALQSLPDGETAQEAPAAADSAPDQINTDILSSEARSYELMGDMAYNKQDYLFAKYCWDRTIELAPGYPGIYRKLGTMVSEHMPEYRETGMQYLKNALIQDPKDAPSQLAAARLAIQNGEYDAAEVYYRSAIGLNPLLKTPENDHQHHLMLNLFVCYVHFHQYHHVHMLDKLDMLLMLQVLILMRQHPFLNISLH